jgi:hypothetical protein
MKKSTENIPVFNSRTRKPEPLSLETLKTTGETFVTYGINTGDVVEFPDNAAEVVAVEQPIRANNPDGPKQRLLQVLKNGKYSWLSLGVLNRTDYNREPTCPFCAEMNELPNDFARIEHLYGKKITCTGRVEKPFQKFDRQTGVRVDGQSEMRPTAVIEYVK